jgi:virulence-associated protein VapD
MAARKEQLTLQIAETRAQWEKETRAHDENLKAEKETRLQTIYKYERELQSKETQGLLNLKDQQVKSLEAKIKEMEVQLKEAASKADNSEKTVKDIALKAIESSGKMQVIERERVKE